MMKKVVHVWLSLLLILISYPVYITFIHSFMGPSEIALNIGGLLEGYDKMVALPMLPSYPTLKPYKDLLLYADKFYQMFWNSCLYSVSTVLGQIIISAPAAFVMATCKFKGKRLLFWIYIIVMLMPFMVSEYLVLKRLAIINTPLAIIMPGIFGTYPVFILTKVFETIPGEIVEAAKLDGAGILRIFTDIFLPIGKGGVMSVAVLGFIEYFNIIEQPLIFLSKELWPLSLFFPALTRNNSAEVFAASIVIMIPAVMVFFWGKDSLEYGIKAFGVKEGM